MKLILVCAVMLSGCASYFDAQDPCQRDNIPDWCGSSQSTTYIVNDQTVTIRKVK